MKIKKLIIICIILCGVFLVKKIITANDLDNKLDNLYNEPISVNRIYNDYTYAIYKDHITIMTYNGKDQEVSIPKSIDGKKVLAIDDSAFYGNQYLKKVVVPSTVIRIGHQTFIGNDNLEEVILPDNLLDLGDWAFRVCPNLKRIYVKKNSITDEVLSNSPFKNYIYYKK